jgi:hypothetical protein
MKLDMILFIFRIVVADDEAIPQDSTIPNGRNEK